MKKKKLKFLRKRQNVRKIPVARIPYRIQKLTKADLIRAKKRLLEQEGGFFKH